MSLWVRAFVAKESLRHDEGHPARGTCKGLTTPKPADAPSLVGPGKLRDGCNLSWAMGSVSLCPPRRCADRPKELTDGLGCV